MYTYTQNFLNGVQLFAEAASLPDDFAKEAEKGLVREAGFRIYETNKPEITIGNFQLSPMPGCCGMVVIHNMRLNHPYQHSYLSQPIRDLKTGLCRALGYTCIIATTRMDQIPAVGNFFKSRYNIVDTFTNQRTRNLIGIGIKKI